MQLILRGDYDEIEQIANFLAERPGFQILEGYRTNVLVSIATGVTTTESSSRLVFGSKEPSTLRIYVREPGEMCIRIEGEKEEIAGLLRRLTLNLLVPPVALAG